MNKMSIFKIFLFLSYFSCFSTLTFGTDPDFYTTDTSFEKTSQLLSKVRPQLINDQKKDFFTINSFLRENLIPVTGTDTDSAFLNIYFSAALLHNAQAFNEMPENLSNQTYEHMIAPLAVHQRKLSALLLIDLLTYVNGHLAAVKPKLTSTSPEDKVNYSFAKLVTGQGRYRLKRFATEEEQRRLAAAIFRQYNGNDPSILNGVRVSSNSLNQLWQEIMGSPRRIMDTSREFCYRLSCFMLATIGIVSAKNDLAMYEDTECLMRQWLEGEDSKVVLFYKNRLLKMYNLLTRAHSIRERKYFRHFATSQLGVALPLKLERTPIKKWTDATSQPQANEDGSFTFYFTNGSCITKHYAHLSCCSGSNYAKDNEFDMDMSPISGKDRLVVSADQSLPDFISSLERTGIYDKEDSDRKRRVANWTRVYPTKIKDFLIKHTPMYIGMGGNKVQNVSCGKSINQFWLTQALEINVFQTEEEFTEALIRSGIYDPADEAALVAKSPWTKTYLIYFLTEVKRTPIFIQFGEHTFTSCVITSVNGFTLPKPLILNLDQTEAEFTEAEFTEAEFTEAEFTEAEFTEALTASRLIGLKLSF